MKILFDLSSAQPQGTVQVNGGGEYATITFREFISRKLDNIQVEVTFNKLNGNNKFLLALCKDNGIKVNYFSNQEELSSIVNHSNTDVLILPVCYPKYSQLSINKEIKVISVIHDLSSLHELKLMGLQKKMTGTSFIDYLRKLKYELKRKRLERLEQNKHVRVFSLSNKQLVFTPSYFSKYAMELFLPEKDETLINVVYPPLKLTQDINQEDENEVLKRFNLRKNEYFLLVSADRWTKNNNQAIKALDLLFQNEHLSKRLSKMKVMVLGANSDSKSYFKKSIKSKNKFVFEGYVPGSDLEILYKNAHLFVYPSLLEGFGYPPIEAMKYNTLTACSVSTSIPEVCGDAVLYFNPFDIDSICISILQSFDLDYVENLKKRMITHYQEISSKQKEDLEKFFYLSFDFING